LSELQGRLPIRVQLKGCFVLLPIFFTLFSLMFSPLQTDLSEDDFFRIMTEPETNLIKQQSALIKTEGVKLTWQEDAIREVARVAREANTSIENIGARSVLCSFPLLPTPFSLLFSSDFFSQSPSHCY
jgi:ATP-dependent HslUV protease ATP-binding subunit HslU